MVTGVVIHWSSLPTKREDTPPGPVLQDPPSDLRLPAKQRWAKVVGQ